MVGAAQAKEQNNEYASKEDNTSASSSQPRLADNSNMSSEPDFATDAMTPTEEAIAGMQTNSGAVEVDLRNTNFYAEQMARVAAAGAGFELVPLGLEVMHMGFLMLPGGPGGLAAGTFIIGVGAGISGTGGFLIYLSTQPKPLELNYEQP